ncbi:ferrochelatase [Sphingobium sp. LB126]|uniref:ferrochelatase n=1 Tax=Sphingobium sp. LB126 TaxID=1983755 RepID=UPI000C20F23A|nr:ferrochelatase [Sphingobium sp. LB126]PJG47156.1 ferrochelatase [Sphingobium sp. LB126]
MAFTANVPTQKVGVLLINLGTPAAPEPRAVKRYLAQFLSDRRVVELPSVLWQPILRGLVLRSRPAKSAEAYASIWSAEGSPLAAYTARQARALSGQLLDSIIEYGMRYGEPSIERGLDALIGQGCDRILLAPLYPQYSAATTATALDCAYKALSRRRAEPAIRTLPPYFADPAYIDALAVSAGKSLAELAFEPQRIIASFHGMPERTQRLGDPYRGQCIATVNRLSAALGREVQVGFQSRFGSARWFEPATDTLIEALPGQGISRIAVIMPGFSVDCVETLEEIGIRGRASFLAAGGSDFALLPCLNHSEPGMMMLERLIRRELAGWLPADRASAAQPGRAVMQVAA